MQLNFAAKEVVLKLVYYGPALSGKTTNLQSLHDKADESTRGRLMTLATRDDRTLFFDVLPLTLQSSTGMTVRIKVFTVPGQVIHASTRRYVLQGADGVAFVADSQLVEAEANAAAFRDLRANLEELGRPIREMPLVLQFNKRDMSGVRSDDELRALAAKGREPIYPAVALKGEGVLECFFGLLNLTMKRLEQDHQLATKTGLRREDVLRTTAAQFGVQGREQQMMCTDVLGKGT